MRRPLTALGLLALALAAGAATAGETARQILDRQRALEDGARRWTDRYEQLQVEVVSPTRPTRQLAIDLFDRKYPDRQQKTMAYFSAPQNVKGTAFLAVTRPDREADQWLYLPEAKRARRIAGEVRRQGFVGTDLSYHDLDLLAAMTSWSETDAASKLRGEESIDGVPCYVIELTPKRADIGYERIVVWLGRDDLVARQVELYETAPSAGWFGLGGSATAPTRRIRQSDVRQVGAIPVPHRVDVETPADRTKTAIVFTQVRFDQGLPDELFGQPAMEWGSFRN